MARKSGTQRWEEGVSCLQGSLRFETSLTLGFFCSLGHGRPGTVPPGIHARYLIDGNVDYEHIQTTVS